MNATGIDERNERAPRSRVRLTGILYGADTLREHLNPENPLFEMRDKKVYGLHPTGAIVRIDKDRRSVKERKRARREARAKGAA